MVHLCHGGTGKRGGGGANDLGKRLAQFGQRGERKKIITWYENAGLDTYGKVIDNT